MSSVLNESDEEIFCCICQGTAKAYTDFSVLSCGHKAHSACLVTWLTKNPKCPLCRKDICSYEHSDSSDSSDSSDDTSSSEDQEETQEWVNEQIHLQQIQLKNLMRRKSSQSHPTLSKKYAKLRVLRQKRLMLEKDEMAPLQNALKKQDAQKERLIRSLTISHRKDIREVHKHAYRHSFPERQSLKKATTKRNRIVRSIERLSNDMLNFQ